MNISSTVTNGRGGKSHVKRGTTANSIIGNENGVVIIVDGEDGRTYRIELWADDLCKIGIEGVKVARN